jgi:Domain of unknown function (DUF4397)
MQRRTWALFCAVLCLGALALFTTACGSSSSNGAKVRMVNAMPDEGSLDLLVDTKSFTSSVGYGSASSYTSLSTGSRHFQIEPTGSTTVLIDRTDSIGSGNFTLLTLNYSFDVSSALLTDDNSAPTSGDFKLRIVDAAPGLNPQDVYIVPAGTDIGSVDPTFSGMTLGTASTYNMQVAGDYDVIFTDVGQKFFNLDSGKLTFAAGQIRTLLALNNLSGGYESTLLTDAN